MTDPRLNPDVPGIWGLITQIRDLLNGFPHARYQFERVGYFCVDRDSTAEKLVFNRTVTLRDTWAKIEKAMKGT